MGGDCCLPWSGGSLSLDELRGIERQLPLRQHVILGMGTSSANDGLCVIVPMNEKGLPYLTLVERLCRMRPTPLNAPDI